MEPVGGDQPPGQGGVEVRHEPDRTVVVLSGEFDLISAGNLDPALDEIGASDAQQLVVLDMSEVTFIDSSGLKPLVRAHARGLRLAVRSASPTVQAVIALTGLDEVLPAEQ